MIHELHDLLHRAGARLRGLRLWSSLAVCWLFWATVVYFVARYATVDGDNWKAVWSILAAATALTALICWQFATRAGRDPHGMAQRIEATHPELGAMLLAALEQAPSPRFKRLGYLQSAVVKGAVIHGRRHNWADATSIGRLRLAKVAHLASLAALASACLLLADRTTARGSASAPTNDEHALVPGASYEAEIQPGDAEIERGTTLLVIARFKGPMPPDADLVVQPIAPVKDETTAAGAAEIAAKATEPAEATAADTEADAQSVRSMTRSLDDPQYVGRVPAVTRPLTYFVDYAGKRSPTYRITVFEYPELVRADANLQYPEYTRLEPKVVEDVRQVTAVEGTQLTLKFRLNKDVADARLIDRDGEEMPLKHAEGADPVYEVSYRLARSQRFKLHLLDAEQRKNKVPPEIVINATPNNPATIKLAKPARDVRVSPVEELQIAANVTDDFGVMDYGLSYSMGGEEPTDVALKGGQPQADDVPELEIPADAAPAKKASLTHLIDFEAIKAEPDQLVSYYVWAEDVGPDGKPRRTLSDMYFAEVRHFEEIFREGEQPTEEQQREQQQQQQQQGGAAQKAEELAELQKQIVNATWKLIRRETADAPTPEFSADATAIQEAQQQAIDKLGELASEVTDAESQRFVENAQKQMQMALDALTKSAEEPEVPALRPALSAEQASYQALLKLRARENNVTRSNGQQSGQPGSASGAGSAAQRQLQQLELSNDQNRYETQSRAQSAGQQNAEQLQESRQILNRLSELARRQQDLNERLRELQSELQAAKTAEERAEIERQLKRLRDQQREVLRDAESLAGDMQNSENREQLEQSAQQLEQTRSRVQEASQALEQGQVSQALTEGTRAERELNTLRDDFRQKTADRFSQELRDLRDAAKQLDERQQQLSEQLNKMNTERQSLRDAGPRDEVLQGLAEQKRQLGETLDKMRDTVTEAEEPEPLLARQLYEAVQQVGQQRTAEALDVAQQLTDAGVSTEASEPMRQAGRGLQQLRQQIDRAAESVLGDETEALRRADEQLQRLQESLDREIQNSQGGQRGEQQGQQASEQSGQRPGEGQGQQPGEGRGQQPGEGQGQQGEDSSEQQGRGRQPGEGQGQQPGEEQPGGEQQGQRGQGQGEGQETRRGQGQGQEPGRGRGQQREIPEGENSQRGAGQERPGEGQPGEQSGEQPGQQSGEQTGQQPGEGQGQQPGQGGQGGGQGQRGQGGQGQGQGDPNAEQPQDGPGDQQGRAPGEGQQAVSETPGEGQGQQPGGQGQQPGGQQGGGQQRGGAAGGPRNNGGGANLGGRGGIENFQQAFSGAEEQARGPITGENFRQWSEGMREVEDMLDDPAMSAEAARIRDRAEAARVDFVRHGKTPDWDKVVEMVSQPLVELREKIAEEIRRKESPDSLVPIDRDAAPAEFSEAVRLYYQRLGSGE